MYNIGMIKNKLKIIFVMSVTAALLFSGVFSHLCAFLLNHSVITDCAVSRTAAKTVTDVSPLDIKNDFFTSPTGIYIDGDTTFAAEIGRASCRERV